MFDEALERERIEDLVTILCGELDLTWLTVRNRYEVREAEETAAEAIGDSKYRELTIRWNMALTSMMDEEALLATAVHELVHGMIGPLWDQIPDREQRTWSWHNELATENVARCLLALLHR